MGQLISTVHHDELVAGVIKADVVANLIDIATELRQQLKIIAHSSIEDWVKGELAALYAEALNKVDTLGEAFEANFGTHRCS
jgi:hypothetical protein